MASKGTQRKLTAILSADVVGYSRLMGADEEATVEAITAYRKVFSNYVEQYRGRVVNAPGDSILAEFASVVDAVNSAVEIQRELAERNAELSDDRRMDFRIGINLGDVVVKDDVIYGDVDPDAAARQGGPFLLTRETWAPPLPDRRGRHPSPPARGWPRSAPGRPPPCIPRFGPPPGPGCR